MYAVEYIKCSPAGCCASRLFVAPTVWCVVYSIPNIQIVVMKNDTQPVGGFCGALERDVASSSGQVCAWSTLTQNRRQKDNGGVGKKKHEQVDEH